MKKIKTVMEELGFNPAGPDSVKEAFIKHLIKSAYGVQVTTPSEKREIQANPQKVKALQPSLPVQLSFNLEDEAQISRSNKKAVS